MFPYHSANRTLALAGLLALAAGPASAVKLNVRDLGAAGNGRDDDTPAIQKVIAGAASGDEVYLPAGVYRLTATLTLTTEKISLAGDGKTSILRAAGPDFSLVRVQADGAAFRDLAFQGAAATDKTRQFGIFTATPPASHGVVRRCSFTGPDKTTGLNCGIKLDTGCNSWTIKDCTFERLIGSTTGTGYGILLGQATDSRILNNRFTGAETGPVHQGRHAVYLSGGASRNLVADNIIHAFNQSSIAIYARANQPACESNVIKHNQIFEQRIGASGSAGVELTGNVTQNRIEANTIEEPASHGIVVTDAREGGRARNNRLLANHIIKAGQFGIFLEGAQGTEVRDNIISDASLANPGTYSAIHLQAFSSGAYSQVAEANTMSGNRIEGHDGNVHYRFAIALNETFPAPTNTSITGNSVKPGKRGTLSVKAASSTTVGNNPVRP